MTAPLTDEELGRAEELGLGAVLSGDQRVELQKLAIRLLDEHKALKREIIHSPSYSELAGRCEIAEEENKALRAENERYRDDFHDWVEEETEWKAERAQLKATAARRLELLRRAYEYDGHMPDEEIEKELKSSPGP